MNKILLPATTKAIEKNDAKNKTKKYNNIEEIMNASYEELCGINEIGEIMAESIVKFFESKQTKDLIERLKQNGVNMESKMEKSQDERFAGKEVAKWKISF